MRHAVVECRSERYLRVDGKPPPPAWDAIAGIYKTRDRRFVRLHTNFPHHREAVCRVLNCKAERDDVQAALMRWDAEAFETAAYAAGGVVAMMRSYEEWSANCPTPRRWPHCRRSRSKNRRGRAETLARGDRPLAGLRVLDLSRVIAGPVAGRTLAAHGADVLLISGPDLPAIPWLTIDTGRGKLTGLPISRASRGRRACSICWRSADIFSQGYRPARLRPRLLAGGAARINPGIIFVSLSAYGHAGPWAERRGLTRWCRPRPALTTPRGRPPALMGRRSCRRKCSITPPAI